MSYAPETISNYEQIKRKPGYSQPNFTDSSASTGGIVCSIDNVTVTEA